MGLCITVISRRMQREIHHTLEDCMYWVPDQVAQEMQHAHFVDVF